MPKRMTVYYNYKNIKEDLNVLVVEGDNGWF